MASEHQYISTACHHGLHDQCRKQCKFCEAPCRCDCHGTYEFYCVKERKKVTLKGSEVTQDRMKNGRPTLRGNCPDCGTKVFKMGSLK